MSSLTVEQEQVTAWLEGRGQRFSEAEYDKAVERAEAGLSRLSGLDVQAWLEGQGYQVVLSAEPCVYGTAIVRATVDVEAKRVVVFQQACEGAFEVVVAHEAFHVLDPNCPESMAELAAHLFAGRASGVGWFPGLLDGKVPPVR